MYLVEIESGREQLYPSVEALAAAIRDGVIGPDSRIFHRASSSWVSIMVHPEYRKAMAARAQEPLPPLARNQWTFFGTDAPGRQADETTEVQGSPPADAAVCARSSGSDAGDPPPHRTPPTRRTPEPPAAPVTPRAAA
jgi:hypothetical protein